MENTFPLIRKLALSDEWQNTYILSRDIGTIQLFENNRNFTYIQNLFLKYLGFYYTIYSDIAMGEVGENVLDSDLYADSYMMYKNKEDKQKFKKQTETIKPEKELNNNGSTWIFKEPSKVK